MSPTCVTVHMACSLPSMPVILADPLSLSLPDWDMAHTGVRANVFTLASWTSAAADESGAHGLSGPNICVRERHRLGKPAQATPAAASFGRETRRVFQKEMPLRMDRFLVRLRSSLPNGRRLWEGTWK